MKRAAEERHLAVHVKKQYLGFFFRGNTPWPRHLQTNRYRKSQRQGGCGKARCFLCHHEKLLGLKTMFELKADEAEKAGFDEMKQE